MDPNVVARIRDLIGEGKLQEAFSAIDIAKMDPGLLSLKSRWAALHRKKIEGTISTEDELVAYNQIVSDTLAWADNPAVYSASNAINKDSAVNIELMLLILNKLRKSIMFYYYTAAIVIVLGVGLFLFLLSNQSTGNLETVGSVFISSISVFPIREIFKRRDRISLLEIICSQTNLSEADIQKINTLFLGKNPGLSF